MASFAGSQWMPMASACRQRELRSREMPGFGRQSGSQSASRSGWFVSGHVRFRTVAASLALALLGAASAATAGPASRKETVLVHSYDMILREPSDRLCFLMFYEVFSTAITREREVFLTTRHNPASRWHETDVDVYARCRILRDVFYLKVELSRKDRDPANIMRIQRTIVDSYGYKAQLEEVLASAAAQAVRSLAQDPLHEQDRRPPAPK